MNNCSVCGHTLERTNDDLWCQQCGKLYKTMWISTTIKKKFMDLILSGLKKSEYKGYTGFWNKRINNLLPNLKQGTVQIRTIHYNCVNVKINFLCGQKSYKYNVLSITLHNSPLRIDGEIHGSYWQISLGARIQ